MSELTFKPASRQGVKLLIGLFGKSGGGKTRTALEIARGIAGPKGRIGLIDSEKRRGSIFADIIQGGFDVLDLDKFTPEDYLEAFNAAQKQVDICVIDSMTHEWNGENGVLELQESELQRMAGNDYKKRDACKMSAWIQPKMRHNKFVRELLRSSIPVICCLRGKDKTHIQKEDGKTKVITDDFSTPIYDGDFIYELLICGEVYHKEGKGGYFRPEKVTHPDVWDLIPKDGEQFSSKHGEALAKWASSDSKPAAKPAIQSSSKQVDETQVAAKKKLWALAKPKYPTVDGFLSFLESNELIEKEQTLSDLTTEQLNFIHDSLSKTWGIK